MKCSDNMPGEQLAQPWAQVELFPPSQMAGSRLDWNQRHSELAELHLSHSHHSDSVESHQTKGDLIMQAGSGIQAFAVMVAMLLANLPEDLHRAAKTAAPKPASATKLHLVMLEKEREVVHDSDAALQGQ